MLLSTTAECMYWTARYFERAQALARLVGGYARLSLDLPSAGALALGPLLPLVGRGGARDAAAARLLVADTENPSSVRGALERARENLRSGRIVTPPGVWVTLNALRTRLSEVDPDDPAMLLEALEAVTRAGNEVEGAVSALMTRDDAYAFWRIGSELERVDMLLRALAVLVPALSDEGERTFDDVRWLGLLDCLGARSMYGRRHHSHLELATVRDFLLEDPGFPRSVRHAAAAIGRELDRLPRPGAPNAALVRLAEQARSPEFVGGAGVDSAERAGFLALVERLITASDACHTALVHTYFAAGPELELPESRSERVLASSNDPFVQLAREHRAVERVLQILDEFAAHALASGEIEREDLLAVVGFFTDFGVLGHHEKEEAILMPALLGEGFAWYDGPLSAMRRDHRHEHYFLRVLTHLGRQEDAWSSEDRRQFVSVVREFSQFLREHMRREQQDVFEPADERLSAAAKAAVAAEFERLDATLPGGVEASSARLATLRRKYRMPLRASA